MNIFSDLHKKELSSFLDKVLNNYYDKVITKNLSINLDKNGIKLINANYKEAVSISIDFLDEAINNQIKLRLSGKKDIFSKLFPIKNSTLLDCTAGYGRDSYILRSMGFNVTMIENSPIMSLLLNHALKKLKLLNFKMYHGNSYDYLNHSKKYYDYIYIDFMFNKLKKNSLSSKNDETLKLISFQENNKNNLIKLAIKKAKLLNFNIYKGNNG